MSIRWRIAALVLAAFAFVTTLFRSPGPNEATIVSAAIAAVSVAILVWFLEAFAAAVRWAARKFGEFWNFPT